ncbi:MAG: hypothetical protein AMXMBFR44_5070 [Candidatus Campbellbacteria bacterium]
MFEKQINQFIEDLARHPLTPNVKNPWDYSRSENEIRRKNLLGYFKKMYELKPKILLVGEAPGYRGCGRVGMPFSSEKLVLSHSFFAEKDVFDIENKEAPIAEASASIVWKTFDTLDFYPLMWATYPYHPHKPGNGLTNRAPKPDEIKIGRQFITRLIDIYGIQKVVAVGRVAEGTLKELNIEAPAVRHPSHGGATLFAQGLADYKNSLRA